MTISPTKIFFAMVLAAGAIAACGGGNANKAPPLAPDPTTPPTDIAEGDAGEPPLLENPYAAADAGATTAPSGTASASTDPPATEKSSVPGSEDSARTLLTQFVVPSADHAALTRSLRPTKNDYKALFDAPTASKVESAQAKDWSSNKAVIKPKTGQTEVKLWSATGTELANGTGNAKEFPGGYKKIAKHLAPNAVFFRFKFVETGKETGTAYDGLAYVNGHWVITPKPWRALEGKGGMDDDGDAPAKQSTPAKKKPKGGKKK
jgi:hypothetical protein